MNKIVIVLVGLLCITFFMGAPGKVKAHEVASDGTMEAILHLDPSDEGPLAGQVQTITVYYNDQNQRFNTAKCSCQISIFNRGQKIASLKTLALSASSSQAYYAFTEPGSYQVKVSGKPSAGSNISTFNISFPVSVEVVPSEKSSANNSTIYLSITATAAFLILSLGSVYLLSKRV